MREFRSNNDDFARRTRRRVAIEISVLVILAGYFWSDWSRNLPYWLEVSVLVFFTAYILFGLAYYPKAKLIAQDFSVHLMDDALGFPNQGDMKLIPYRDLTISKVTKKNGEVIEIRLKTKFGQSIKLQGLENMKELYETISAHVGHGT
jgi:hypothetical protein